MISLILFLILSSEAMIPETNLDPQSKAFLDQLNALNLPGLEEESLEKVRADVESHAFSSSITLAAIKNITIENSARIEPIPLRIYIPDEHDLLPVILYFHGGGWTICSVNTHDHFCRLIAKLAQVVVVSVDYHLAPEYKFPTQINECFIALEWVKKHIHTFNGNPQKLAVAGDSAGGTLATLIAQRAAEENIALQAQVLIYPCTNFDMTTTSYEKCSRGYFLTKSMMQWYMECYFNDLEESKSPAAAPLLIEDVSCMPKTLIILAEYDPLFDEGKAYAEKLRAAGVQTNMLAYPTFHPFVTVAPHLDIAENATHDITTFLRQILHEDKN